MNRIVGASIALVLTACSGASPPSGSRSIPKRSGATASPSAPAIVAMQLLSRTVGWALTESALVRSNDGGDSWTNITPPGTRAVQLAGVWFLDPLRGWAARPPLRPDYLHAGSLQLFRTQDGGKQWRSTTIAVDPAPYGRYGPAYLFFIDPRRGWLSFDLGNNTAGTSAMLFFTADGGATWIKRSIPLNDPVVFSSIEHGWTAGGPGGDRLYETIDGGRSWRPRSVGAPSSCASPARQVGMPTFWSSSDGVLPVTYVRDGGVAAVFYRTRDGGHSWQPTTPVCLGPTVTNFAATDAVSASVWLAAFGDGKGIFVSNDAGEHWTKTSFDTISPSQIDYATSDFGWWWSMDGRCARPKADCSTVNELLRVSGSHTDRLDPQPTK